MGGFQSPFAVRNGQISNVWPRLWGLMLVLRRQLPPGPARLALRFLLPELRDVAVGFVHDSQITQDEARLAAIEYNERQHVLNSAQASELKNAANAMIRHGCPLRLPPWHHLL